MRPARRLCVLLLSTAGAAALAAAAAPVEPLPLPPLPLTAPGISGFVPDGWKLSTTVRGDLNGDGLEDVAFVLLKPWEVDQPDQVRGFAIVLGQKDGGYHRVVAVDDYLETQARAAEVVRLTIERGGLTVAQRGGAGPGWTETDRFRWEGGEFVQIGHTSTDSDINLGPDGSGFSHDVNLLNGYAEDRTEEWKLRPRRKVTTTARYFVLPAVSVKSVDARLEQPLNRPLHLQSRPDIISGAAGWHGPADLSATLSAATMGTGAGSSLYIRVQVRDDHVLPQDTVRLIAADGQVLRPVAARRVIVPGGYAWQGRYSLDALEVTDPAEDVYADATVEVVDFDTPKVQHALLSACRTGRKDSAEIWFAGRPGLPPLGPENTDLLYSVEAGDN